MCVCANIFAEYNVYVKIHATLSVEEHALLYKRYMVHLLKRVLFDLVLCFYLLTYRYDIFFTAFLIDLRNTLLYVDRNRDGLSLSRDCS